MLCSFYLFTGMITLGGIVLTEAGGSVKLQHIMVLFFFGGREGASPWIQ